MKRFACVTQHEWIGGVLAGLAYSLGWPTWLVRLLFFLAAISTTVANFLGISLSVVYILLWIFVPNWQQTPADYVQRTGDRGDN